MKIYRQENVFDAALRRISWIYDNFRNVTVCVSGGKDSTVIFNLAKIVAREKGLLPVRCMFIDQEAEWQATIDTITEMMEDEDVEPRWYQMPLKLFNATSTQDHWLQCWAPEEESRWMREKVPYSIKENVYGTDRFAKLFRAIQSKEHADESSCYIGGVRAEESPGRSLGLTGSEVYKGETWGSINNRKKDHYTMYPIYDWATPDVWKSIHDNKWSYCKLYDYMYQYGIAPSKMRVSNLHHETAVHALFFLQEIEGDTYVKLTERLSGIDTAGKMGPKDFFGVGLPYMFKSWREYRDFLLEKLIDDEKWKEGFKKIFARHDAMFEDLGEEVLCRTHIASILTNDWEHIKLRNFETAPQNLDMKKAYRKKMREQRESSQKQT